MNENQARALKSLIESQRIAALGTLHDGEPYVSMVPYAVLPAGRSFILHVSALAAHTKDMELDPRVSLLVTAAPEPSESVRALARATIRCRAERIPESDPRYEEAAKVYLEKFPDSEPMFGFRDFSLFLLEPREVRFVGGFAQATTIDAAKLAKVMGGLP